MSRSRTCSSNSELSSTLPPIDPRDRRAIVTALQRRQAGYVPEWIAPVGSVGGALTQVLGQYLEGLGRALNQVPQRSFLAFLDTAGGHLLPARAARAPLVFSLVPNCLVDVNLPAGSRIGAVPPLPAPTTGGSAPTSPPPVVFATTETVTLSHGTLVSLACVQPEDDQYADYSALLAQGFSLFDSLQACDHILYLGHDVLFALTGDVIVFLEFSLAVGATTPLQMAWEYYTGSDWLGFDVPPDEDTTGGLTTDGQVALYRVAGPDAASTTIDGKKSYWIRGRLADALPPGGSAPGLPLIDTIRARLKVTKPSKPSDPGIAPDAAFVNGIRLDPSKDFLPFGPYPAVGTTFYLACRDAFSRPGAFVQINVVLSDYVNVYAATTPTLAWEYWNGSIWATPPGFSPDPAPPTSSPPSSTTPAYDFGSPGGVAFQCPFDWVESTYNAVKNFWLRVRLVSGDYGQPIHVEVSSTSPPTPILVPATLQPPSVKSLTLAFSYLTGPEPLDHCVPYNDFAYDDEDAAARWSGQPFAPFRPVVDLQPTVYFGFDQPPPAGLVSIYVDGPPTTDTSTFSLTPSFVWEYQAAAGWAQLGVLDETAGFQRRGMIQFVGPPDAIKVDGLGGALYRVRARLKPGIEATPLELSGVWLNAVWAAQNDSWSQEPLGTSDGNTGQTFNTQHQPVLEGELVEVQEWTGLGDAWQTLLADVPLADLRFERDPVTNVATAAWVTWHVTSFFSSADATARTYLLERATGLVRFGDGQYGPIPPPDRSIVISYQSGGGMIGNVAAGTITQLRTAAPLVISATNPVAASGGADVEAIPALLQRGPQRLRNGNRAVSASDFEWLAHEASPGVARARCLPLVGADGHAQRGWATVLIVPFDVAAQPYPASELIVEVQAYLAAQAPAQIANQILIVGPSYQPVGVQAELAPVDPGQAAAVEAGVRADLDQFLHPLTGGLAGQGWGFGEQVHLSQVAARIRRFPGVAYVRSIYLLAEGQIFDETVPVDPNELICAGVHELTLIVGES